MMYLTRDQAKCRRVSILCSDIYSVHFQVPKEITSCLRAVHYLSAQYLHCAVRFCAICAKLEKAKLTMGGTLVEVAMFVVTCLR